MAGDQKSEDKSERKSKTVIPVVDGPDHGYFGTVRDDTPNEDYSVAGVTKAGQEEPEPKKPPVRSARSPSKS